MIILLLSVAFLIAVGAGLGKLSGYTSTGTMIGALIVAGLIALASLFFIF